MIKRIYILLILFSAAKLTFAQKYKLNLYYNPGDFVPNLLEQTNGNIGDSSSLISSLNFNINKVRAEGFLLASVDSLFVDKNQLVAQISIGNKFEWASFSPGNLPQNIIARIGFSNNNFQNQSIKSARIRNIFKDIIKYSENHGYPFASVKLDSAQLNGTYLSASLNYNPGPIIRYDSLQVLGEVNINHRFLERYLGVEQGRLYEDKRMKDIPGKLNSLPFLILKKPIRQSFQNDEATIYLELEERKVNRIDGIVGILPRQSTNDKTLVTGKFDLSLYNLFNSGKQFSVNWQRVREESQFLDLIYLHPNFLRSNLNFRSTLQLLKEDTTFFNLSALFGLSYQVGNKYQLQFFSKIKSGRLSDDDQFSGIASLPQFSDLNINSYGLGLEYHNLDHPFNPRKGVTFHLDFSIGSKEIKRNLSLDPSVYSDIDLKSQQLELYGKISTYLQISQRITFMSDVEFGKLFNDNLFKNDLYRLGGLKTIRGFNQNFFFASEYSIVKIEPRLYFSPYSFLFTFFDLGLIKEELPASLNRDKPFGFGAGVSLELKSGTISIAYAMGSSKNQSASPNFSKVHFGYLAKF